MDYDIRNGQMTECRSAIRTGTDGTPEPCRAISLSADGTVTLTNPDGTTLASIALLGGIIHPISTKVALTSSATVFYWY